MGDPVQQLSRGMITWCGANPWYGRPPHYFPIILMGDRSGMSPWYGRPPRYFPVILTGGAQSRSAHDDARRGARAALVGGELLPHAAGDVAIGLGVRALRLGDDDRVAAVGRRADVEVQRHLAQERHAHLLGFLVRAAMAKDFRTH